MQGFVAQFALAITTAAEKEYWKPQTVFSMQRRKETRRWRGAESIPQTLPQ